jgi:hypothetical protein
MEITNEHLKQALGKEFNPNAEYVIDTHRGAVDRTLSGQWKPVGKVPDSTDNENGTMVVMEKINPPVKVGR